VEGRALWGVNAVHLTVQILTPDGVLFEADDAALVVAPGEGGDLGVEPNHTNLITTLRVGEARIRAGGDEHRFATHGGFLEATPTRVRIVVDAAERAAEIDVERARLARRRAKRRLKRPKKDTDITRAEAALKRALLRLDIAEKSGRI